MTVRLAKARGKQLVRGHSLVLEAVDHHHRPDRDRPAAHPRQSQTGLASSRNKGMLNCVPYAHPLKISLHAACTERTLILDLRTARVCQQSGTKSPAALQAAAGGQASGRCLSRRQPWPSAPSRPTSQTAAAEALLDPRDPVAQQSPARQRQTPAHCMSKPVQSCRGRCLMSEAGSRGCSWCMQHAHRVYIH